MNTYDRVDKRIDDGIQHGIDDDPNNDAEKGAVIGGLGGAAVGAAAGAMAGPVGAVIGAAVGGLAGAAGSGAAVGAIDRVDNDNNVVGTGEGVDYDEDMDDELSTDHTIDETDRLNRNSTPIGGTGTILRESDHDRFDVNDTIAGSTDTRGPGERMADAVTGDPYDDKTGRIVR